MPDIILKTHNLGKKFKTRWAVSGLNLEIHSGEVFGFLGPNGAGKSTTIRMLLSLIAPTTGDVEIFGHSLDKQRTNALKNVGGIVEKPDFYLYLSAVRNLEIVSSLFGGVEKKRIYELLDLVGLKSREIDKVKTYSHGMKQRLGIAQALLSDPHLVILDEPTSGLDPSGMKEVRELIVHLSRDRGKTVFISSHLLSEIQMIADRMAIINNGELIVQGEVKKLLEEQQQNIHLKAEPRESVQRILKRNHKIISQFEENEYGFNLRMNAEDVPALTKQLVRNGISIFSITPRRSLEEYFLSITGEKTIT